MAIYASNVIPWSLTGGCAITYTAREEATALTDQCLGDDPVNRTVPALIYDMSFGGASGNSWNCCTMPCHGITTPDGIAADIVAIVKNQGDVSGHGNYGLSCCTLESPQRVLDWVNITLPAIATISGTLSWSRIYVGGNPTSNLELVAALSITLSTDSYSAVWGYDCLPDEGQGIISDSSAGLKSFSATLISNGEPTEDDDTDVTTPASLTISGTVLLRDI